MNKDSDLNDIDIITDKIKDIYIKYEKNSKKLKKYKKYNKKLLEELEQIKNIEFKEHIDINKLNSFTLLQKNINVEYEKQEEKNDWDNKPLGLINRLKCDVLRHILPYQHLCYSF